MDQRRERLRRDLNDARDRFHAALDTVPDGEWHAPSANPGWTNAQILFHVLLGFLLVPLLLRILSAMTWMPSLVDRGFAGLLNATTPLFDRVNAIGPRVGARLLSRAAMRRRFDRVHARLVRRLERMTDRDLERGMRYPTRWDPRFRAIMTAADGVVTTLPAGGLNQFSVDVIQDLLCHEAKVGSCAECG